MFARKVLRQEDQPLERRVVERLRLRREGWLRGPRAEIVGVVILDLARDGVGLALLAPAALEVGDRVEVALEMSSADEELWLPCVVRWRTRDRLGLSFSTLGPKARTLLGRLVSPNRSTPD